jgi:hypothetical protein
MERDTIIFSGASHTFGLGLEWELDPELNSEEYLQKGINIPIPRLPHYQNYWREYRWPTLVCRELGYKQYNVHDAENNHKIGGNAVDSIFMMVKDEDKIKDLLNRTKYVILEVGYIRWYDEDLHGGENGHEYPNTIQEMIDLINNPKSNHEIVSKTLEWIKQVDPNVYMLELYNRISYLQKKYPEIKFLILPWHTNYDGIDGSSILGENIIHVVENGRKYLCVYDFQQKNNIQVWNSAKAFNGNYKFNYREDHGSIEGHNRVANIVINHIKKMEDNFVEKINLI